LTASTLQIKKETTKERREREEDAGENFVVLPEIYMEQLKEQLQRDEKKGKKEKGYREEEKEREEEKSTFFSHSGSPTIIGDGSELLTEEGEKRKKQRGKKKKKEERKGKEGIRELGPLHCTALSLRAASL